MAGVADASTTKYNSEFVLLTLYGLQLRLSRLLTDWWILHDFDDLTVFWDFLLLLLPRDFIELDREKSDLLRCLKGSRSVYM